METRTVKFTSKEAHNYPDSFWEHDVHYITNIKAVPAGEDACNIQVTLEDLKVTLEDLKVTLESTEPLDAEWTEWVESALECNARHSQGISLENEAGVATFTGDFYPA